MSKKVSVIIPNYNNAHYLGTAVQSVLRQTFRDYEIIIIDDGSTDNSKDVADDFGEKVFFIRQENQGLAGARNTGIRTARGELIGLLDADDEWQPEYLEQMIVLAEKNSDAIIFYCMAQCMDQDGQNLPQFVGGPPIEPELHFQRLLRANFIIPSTVTFRKKPIVDAGSFDANLRSCEDWDLWLRLLPSSRMIGSSNCLVRYRVHGSSLSTNVDGMHAATKKVIEKHFGRDDGKPQAWTSEKRRAYGGVYRYQCITLVQRQGNWIACVPLMRKAFQADPSLAQDLDFFYELALGMQMVGYRGVSEVQGLEENAAELESLLHEVFTDRDLISVRNTAYATAFQALGLVFYNLGTRSSSRKFLIKSMTHRPELILNIGLVANFLKSFLGKGVVENVKKLFRQPS